MQSSETDRKNIETDTERRKSERAIGGKCRNQAKKRNDNEEKKET